MADPDDDLPDEVKRKLDATKRKKRLDEAKILDTMLTAISHIMLRYRKNDDPVLRYTMFVDKLAMGVEISCAVLMSGYLDFSDVKEGNFDGATILPRATKLSAELRDEINRLMDWIQSPNYGPDHPVGRKFMSETEENFADKVTATEK